MSAIGRIGAKGTDGQFTNIGGANFQATPNYSAGYSAPVVAKPTIDQGVSAAMQMAINEENKKKRKQAADAQRQNATASARAGRRSTVLTDTLDQLNTLLGSVSGTKTLLGI